MVCDRNHKSQKRVGTERNSRRYSAPSPQMIMKGTKRKNAEVLWSTSAGV